MDQARPMHERVESGCAGPSGPGKQLEYGPEDNVSSSGCFSGSGTFAKLGSFPPPRKNQSVLFSLPPAGNFLFTFSPLTNRLTMGLPAVGSVVDKVNVND